MGLEVSFLIGLLYPFSPVLTSTLPQHPFRVLSPTSSPSPHMALSRGTPGPSFTPPRIVSAHFWAGSSKARVKSPKLSPTVSQKTCFWISPRNIPCFYPLNASACEFLVIRDCASFFPTTDLDRLVLRMWSIKGQLKSGLFFFLSALVIRRQIYTCKEPWR